MKILYIAFTFNFSFPGLTHALVICQQEAIFRTLAAILHLGNIEFSPGREYDSSVIKDQKSTIHMQMVADLLRWVILEDSFESCLVLVVYS